MADNVDYLGYAQAMNQLNPYAALGQQIGGTLSDIAARQRTEREAAPARELADIQLQTARRGLEEDIAKRAATQQVMGGADLTSTYAAQMKKAQRAEQTKSFTEGFDKLVASKSSPEALKRYTQAALSKDPDLATWAPYINYVDEGSIKITKPFGPNEAPDPTRPGSFLPPGVYTVTGSRTNDPTNPFAFQLIEPAKAEKPDQEALMEKRFQYQSELQSKQIAAQDRRLERQLAASERKEAIKDQRGKEGKPLPATQLESITDMKKVRDTLMEAQDMASKISTGPAVGRLQSIGATVGLAGDEFTDFQQKLASVENIMLKLRSGAAVTDQEFARFKREYPNPNDPPNVLKRKLENTIAYATTLMGEKLDVYEEGGYKVPRQSVSKTPATAGAPGVPPAAPTKRPPLSSFRKR